MNTKTGIIKTTDPENLKQIQNPETLLAVWERPVPQAVITCLEKYDFQRHFERTKAKGSLSLSWRTLMDIGELRDFRHQIELFRDQYCQSTGAKNSHVLLGVFEPGFKAGDHIWHRDAGNSIAGITIFNPKTKKPSGHFKYAARNEEHLFKARSEGLELTCLDKTAGTEAPHGALILMQHGRQGVIHTAQNVKEGVRIRAMFTPK